MVLARPPPSLPFVRREEGEVGGAAGASASGNWVASCSVIEFLFVSILTIQ